MTWCRTVCLFWQGCVFVIAMLGFYDPCGGQVYGCTVNWAPPFGGVTGALGFSSSRRRPGSSANECEHLRRRQIFRQQSSFGSKKGHNKPLNTTESALNRRVQLTRGVVQNNNKRKKEKTMKLKIRGLIFTGFAAAVFAQSAMAVTPPSEANLTDTQVDDLKKTVTSKYYVNENFQERETTGLGYDSSTQEYAKKSVYVPWKYGEGGITKEWVELEGKKQLATDSTLDTEYVEIVHAGKGGDGHYVQINTAAVTTEEQNASGADKIAAAGEDGATDLEKGRLTTAKAVYDFVTDELDSIGADIRGNATYHTQKVAVMDADWISEHPGDAPYVVSPTGSQLDHIHHWELIVPDSTVTIDEQNNSGADKIAAAGVSGASDAVKNKLTTAKAVYDYAQPKATAAYGNSGLSTPSAKLAQVGVQVDGTSTWYGLAAGQDGRTLGSNVQDAPYARVYRDNGASTSNAGVYVDLDHSRVMLASTYSGSDFQKGIANVSNLVDGNGLTLATAGAVKEYVDSVTGGQSIPAMPVECQQANVHCALVSKVTTPANGTDPTASGFTEGTVVLEWTVMAGAEASNPNP